MENISIDSDHANDPSESIHNNLADSVQFSLKRTSNGLQWFENLCDANQHHNLDHIRTKDLVNVLVHLYRGEVTQSTAFRIRLDTTSNWAVTLVGVIAALALGRQEVSHYVFVFNIVIALLFNIIEAMRYQTYCNSTFRKSLLERGLFAPLLGSTFKPEDNRWALQLGERFQNCDLKCDNPTLRMAFLIRFKRMYVLLYVGIYAAWIVKAIEDDFWNHWVTFLVLTVLLVLILILAQFFINDTNSP